MKQLQFDFKPQPDLDTLLDNGCGCIPFQGNDRTDDFLDMKNTTNHLSEDARERLAADHLWNTKYKRILDMPVVNGYRIPPRNENPSGNYKALRSWIKEFTDVNRLKRPDDFWRKRLYQLEGMFAGMSTTYGFQVSDITGREPEIIY